MTNATGVIARHDYLPFGEEIGSNIGSRSTTPGYAATDANRSKYALLERDDTTGLDHTGWRKYENLSGRWTSPDPLGGGIIDPQSFNHYSYVKNDPVNMVDPSGLDGISFTRPPRHFPDYPNSLFQDYMIDSWNSGWSQMYGLNPTSFAFETIEVYARVDKAWQVRQVAVFTLRFGSDSWDGATGGAFQDPRNGRFPTRGHQEAYWELHKKHLRECLDAALKKYKEGLSAAGITPTRAVLRYINAYRPHLSDLVPMSIGALVGRLAGEAFGPWGFAASAATGPASRIFNATREQLETVGTLRSAYETEARNCRMNP